MMRSPILEFTAHGSPRDVSSAVEACAAERRLVNALVVPWECTPTLLSIAVTSTKVDGWAIEHTNLGTITLADVGDRRTKVSVTVAESSPDSPNPGTRDERVALLTAFARQIERRLVAASQ